MELDEALSNPQYWTCFGFEGHHPDEFHCTHKFLGELSDEDAKSVEKLIDIYFDKMSAFKPFQVTFDQEEWFGENEDVHVLSTKMDRSYFYLDLKRLIDRFREDDWDYNPHVTCEENIKKWNKPIIKYYFLKGDDILREWS